METITKLSSYLLLISQRIFLLLLVHVPIPTKQLLINLLRYFLDIKQAKTSSFSKFINQIYNIQIAATTPDEVGEDVIMAKLRAAGGANYGAQQVRMPFFYYLLLFIICL